MKRLIERSGTGILMLLTATAMAAPTPEQCREAGVLIPDGSQPANSVIVEEVLTTPDRAQALCQSPFEPRRGCAMVVWPGYNGTPSEWVIVYTDAESWLHELCAVTFNLPRHEHTAP